MATTHTEAEEARFRSLTESAWDRDFPDTGSGISRETGRNAAGWSD